MDVSDLEVVRRGRRKWAMPLTVALIRAAALLAALSITSRRTVRLTLINNSGGPLCSIRIDYSGGSLTVPDLAPGGFAAVKFRPRRSVTSSPPGIYETTIHLETVDGTLHEDRTRSDKINFWDDRVCAVERLSNRRLTLLNHASRRSAAGRVVDRLFGR